ncbi:MAG TPA: histidine phosphatase family protein [Tabrizicola sp.]|nr:histidine phosphatase family protein [Tabrizicola sp.]
MPEILILRHGQTEWNLARRFQGMMDSPLTDLGVRQANAQGRILAAHLGAARNHQMLASPQPRALRTAELALGGLGRVALPDTRLREIALGEWEGLRREDVALRHVLEEDDVFWWMDHAPGGEGHAAVAARTSTLLAEISRPTILVTHGIASCHLRGQLLGLSLSETATLTGEQGVVYCIRDGQETVLRDTAA